MLHECKSLKPYQNQQVFEKMMVKNQGVTTIYLTKVQMLYEITNHIDVRYNLFKVSLLEVVLRYPR